MLPREDERYQGVEKHSSGFKLLASMGWKEGEGLVSSAPGSTQTWLRPVYANGQYLSRTSLQGAKRQGLKHHIKVRKMQENAGIGLVRVLCLHRAAGQLSNPPVSGRAQGG